VRVSDAFVNDPPKRSLAKGLLVQLGTTSTTVNANGGKGSVTNQRRRVMRLPFPHDVRSIMG
jgi:hypothetical protein